MELEDQVCSLELAKRLKELRVKQQSLFYWIKYKFKNGTPKEGWGIAYLSNIFSDKDNFAEILSAYTVAELGKMLPRNIIFHEEEYTLVQNFNYDGSFSIGYSYNNTPISFEEKTEANARAKMLIHLIENNLVKVEDINNENSNNS